VPIAMWISKRGSERLCARRDGQSLRFIAALGM
jgi:hypothetical protein